MAAELCECTKTSDQYTFRRVNFMSREFYFIHLWQLVTKFENAVLGKKQRIGQSLCTPAFSLLPFSSGQKPFLGTSTELLIWEKGLLVHTPFKQCWTYFSAASSSLSSTWTETAALEYTLQTHLLCAERSHLTQRHVTIILHFWTFTIHNNLQQWLKS